MSVEWKVGSESKRGPSWEELVNQAARELGFGIPDLLRVRGTDIQILEYFKIKKAGETQLLKNWLLRSMQPPDKALRLSPIHRELAKLKKCNLFYTTNFDDLIERAFDIHRRRYRSVAVESDMGNERSICEIIKFHGDLNHPSEMVLSESDYERRLSLSSAMDYRLRGDILGRVLLFMGYSFRDVNVSYLFRLITDQFKSLLGAQSGRRAYIVVPEPSDFEIELFGARNIAVIPVSSLNQTQNVADLLKALRG
ncbi:MAG: SIR2 family protein [Nitrospira sp.]|nr:MAG: SIR2 family protein [Nitrospira sp.]